MVVRDDAALLRRISAAGRLRGEDSQPKDVGLCVEGLSHPRMWQGLAPCTSFRGASVTESPGLLYASLQVGDRVEQIRRGKKTRFGIVGLRDDDSIHIAWDPRPQFADLPERFALADCGTLRRAPRRAS